MNRTKSKAYCTIILAAVNVVLFFYLTFQGMTEDGEFMLEHGAMYVPYLLEYGEYYRLFTCMFMHFGFEHLINNMVMLLVIGQTLEPELGRIKFLLIYFLSGLCGSICSAFWDIRTQDFAISAGASGAVFGIVGAMLYAALRNRGHIGDISGRGLVFMTALSLYFGFTSAGVDNSAHIGGLVSGFIMAVLLYWKRKGKHRRRTRR